MHVGGEKEAEELQSSCCCTGASVEAAVRARRRRSLSLCSVASRLLLAACATPLLGVHSSCSAADALSALDSRGSGLLKPGAGRGVGRERSCRMPSRALSNEAAGRSDAAFSQVTPLHSDALCAQSADDCRNVISVHAGPPQSGEWRETLPTSL